MPENAKPTPKQEKPWVKDLERHGNRMENWKPATLERFWTRPYAANPTNLRRKLSH